MENLGIIHFLSPLLIYTFLVLINFLLKVWWKPRWIKSALESEGIKGPPYKFFHGNSKEISQLMEKATSRSMELSHDILPKVLPHIHLWTNLYGKNFVNWQGSKAELVITEPELIRQMLNDKEQFFCKSDIDKYMKKVLGNGLLESEGEKWTKLRKLANKSFHAESLRNMFPSMIESVETMLERWRDFEGKEMDAHEEFRALMAEIISRTAFGSSYLEGQEIFKMLRELVMLSSKNAYKIRLPLISKFSKNSDDIECERIEKRIRESIIGIMKKREKLRRGEGESFGDDFLGLHLNAHYDSNENDKISIDDIIDECKTFYSAGHGTTSILLSWTIFLLAIHKDWQEKARKEVLRLFGQNVPTSEGISRLKTMSMIINESLRLYPPAVYTERKTKKGAKLGNIKLPANINVQVPIVAVHHDPTIWGEDANLFNPERFSEGVAAATKNNPAAFLPFSLGPRTCVGLNFAINEAKITLSMVLQRYAFTLSPVYIHSPIQIVTLRPQHGIQVVLHSL